MSPRTPTTRLLELMRRRRVAASDNDPADQGTAFGMEMSLMPGDLDAAAERRPTHAGPAWLRRLMRRRVD